MKASCMSKTLLSQYITFMLLFYLAFPTSLFSQSIHLVLVSDTDDYSIGDGCEMNEGRIERQLASIGESCGMDVKIYHNKSHTFSVEAIEYTLQNIKITKDDVIWFYYSGHGINASQSEWPKLLIDGTTLQLTEVHRNLLGMGARLTITTGDCCNVGTPRSVASNHAPLYSSVGARGADEQMKKQNYSKLFKKAKGEIIMSGSRVGEYARYSDALGGFFTLGLCETLYNAGNNTQLEKTNWEQILNDTYDYTLRSTTDVQVPQHPQYKIDINGNTASSASISTNQNGNYSTNSFSLRKHRVRSGETMYKIARRYKVSAKALIDSNPQISNPSAIRPGMVITIPR
jgi:LysM repeat protein